MKSKLHPQNIVSLQPIITPRTLKRLYRLSDTTVDTVLRTRAEISNILAGTDSRMLAIVGPCSIHDTTQAMEYARKLQVLQRELQDKILVVMRVYFEKPRTTVGWKGLINDPHLDDSFELEEGLNMARRLMVDLNDMGMPIATEALDPFTPQYLSDLVAWSAIGARTTESQTHREMASSLSSPVGFKNGTDGGLAIAMNAMVSASAPHSFLSINEDGKSSIIKSTGNKDAHLILRGGATGPNYHAEHIRVAEETLTKHKLPLNIVVDCSHDNSNKNYKNQGAVLRNILAQKQAGNTSIKGIMLESHIHEGKQSLNMGHKEELAYGVSITDGCISFEDTDGLLREMYSVL